MLSLSFKGGKKNLYIKKKIAGFILGILKDQERQDQQLPSWISLPLLSAAYFVLGYVISLSLLKPSGMTGSRVLLVLIQMEIRTASKIHRKEEAFSLSPSPGVEGTGHILLLYLLTL